MEDHPLPPVLSAALSYPNCIQEGAPGTLVQCDVCIGSISGSEQHICIDILEEQEPHDRYQRCYHIKCFACVHCRDPIDLECEEFIYSRMLSVKAGLNTKSNRRATTRIGIGASAGRAARVSVSDYIDDLNANNGAEDTTNHGYDGNVGYRDGADQQQQLLAPVVGRDMNGGQAWYDSKDDGPYPFHLTCFARRFGWLCVVCEKPLPMRPTNHDYDSTTETFLVMENTKKKQHQQHSQKVKWGRTTKVEFLRHPFFSSERICPHHTIQNIVAGNKVTLQQLQREHFGTDNDCHRGRIEHDNNGGDVILGGTTTPIPGYDHDSGEKIRQCASCHRFEPFSPVKQFVNVGVPDSGMCLCLACCRTVVTTSEDAIPLWDRVIDFFEGPLGLLTSEDSCNSKQGEKRNRGCVTRQDLKNIPVTMVEMEALNNSQNFPSKTRGMCLYDHGIRLVDELSDKSDSDDQSRIRSGSGVTAILCLIGLPSDLTASILAHEATHAYMMLHPNFFVNKDPLPLIVEEGLAQLVAYLFLSNDSFSESTQDEHQRLQPHIHPMTADYIFKNGIDMGGNKNVIEAGRNEGCDFTPSNEELRQYFRYCIETDESAYGEGFRMAARAYAEMGMEDLLYYVACHRSFPEK